jgi:hypothetical protein
VNRKDDAELKARVERSIGAVSGAVWEAVDEESKEAAINDAPGAFDCLLDRTRSIRRVEKEATGRKQRPPKAGDYPQPKLSGAEGERSKVMARVFARLARKSEPVIDFRKRYVGQGALTESEAVAFLNSPAYQLMSGDQIESAGMPIVGLQASKGRFSVELATLRDGSQFGAAFQPLHCRWGAQERVLGIRLPTLQHSTEIPWSRLKVRLGSREPLEVKFLPGSVIHELEGLADYLAWEFWWPKSEALAFALTDSAPPSRGIYADVRDRAALIGVHQARVTLEIQPWVSAAVVRRVYQHARRWVFGGPYRGLSAESLTFYDFCAERFADGESPYWSP